MNSDPEKELLYAKKAAYRILAYADNTEAMLRAKLARRGFSADAISAAITELRASGALDEQRMLQSRQAYLVETKKYGKRRAIMELLRTGFPRELVARADWSDFDFVANCAQVIARAGGLDKKLYTSLLRRGYSPAEIKAAAALVAEEEQ